MQPPAGLTGLHRRECRRSWAAGGGRSGSRAGRGALCPLHCLRRAAFLALLSLSFLVSLLSFPRLYPCYLALLSLSDRRLARAGEGLQNRAHTHTGDAGSRSRLDRPGPGRVLSGVPRTCRASAPLAAGCRCLRSDSRRGREEVGGALGQGGRKSGRKGGMGRTDGRGCLRSRQPPPASNGLRKCRPQSRLQRKKCRPLSRL